MDNESQTKSELQLNQLETATLLDEIQRRITRAQKAVAMASLSTSLSPVEEAGKRIRAERKKQGLTLNELCEISGVAYATLNKLEHGHASIRLDCLNSVARALGLKLWIG